MAFGRLGWSDGNDTIAKREATAGLIDDWVFTII